MTSQVVKRDGWIFFASLAGFLGLDFTLILIDYMRLIQ